MTQQPNFVIIVPDQLRADALGCLGNPVAKTPHLDELAESGTIFTEAYVQNPLCAPSRASFLTGWYSHVRGHRTNTNLLQADEPNLLRILKEAGYHVTWPGTRGDTFAPGVTEQSVHEYGMIDGPDRPRRVDRIYPSADWARIQYLGCVGGGGQDLHDEPAVRTAEQWLAASPPEPWVLFLPLIAPHCPFQVEEPWFSLHERAAMPDPVPIPDGPEPAFRAEIRAKYELDKITPEMWKEVIAVYYGMVSRLDDHVGRIQRALRDSGMAERTISILFSDHGEYLGDFGLIEKWMSGMDTCLTRTPLIFSGGGLQQGQESPALVELIDVLPTVLDLAGIDAPHHHFGRSLMPVLGEPDQEHREYVFTEGGVTVAEESKIGGMELLSAVHTNHPFSVTFKLELEHEQPKLAGRAIAVRDRKWTYVWRLYEPPELYHRGEDPNETVNLTGRPDVADVERRMEQALLRWRIETADVIPAEVDPRTPHVALPKPNTQRKLDTKTVTE